jgi:hypothetical protein
MSEHFLNAKNPHNHHKSSPKIHRRGINGALFQSWEGPMAFLVGALVFLTRGENRGEPRVGIAPLVCSLWRLWENRGNMVVYTMCGPQDR